MHIGRPKGYVPPAPGEVVPDALPRAMRERQEQQKAAAVEASGAWGPGIPTTTLLLSNILPAGQLRTESDRRIVSGGLGGAQPAACNCWPLLLLLAAAFPEAACRLG